MTGLTTHMPIDPGPLAGTRPVDAAVRQRAIPHLGRSAIVEGDRCVSYAELQGRVERLARVLQRLGVQRHDRIAVLSENRAEQLETLLAAGSLGAIVACQNARQSDAELEHCLRLVEPLRVRVSPRHAARLAAVRHGARQVLEFGAAFERLLAAEEAGASASRAFAEDVLLILYTSGTTGLPKGAAISHRAEVARAMIGAIDGQLYAGLGSVVWSPLDHIGGLRPGAGRADARSASRGRSAACR